MEEANESKKFMQEYRENVITKIDELQNKLNLVINESLDDMKSTILDFNNKINNKLKVIDLKFKNIQDENEKMKKEISSNKFDESNFQNVSMIRKMNKEVYEKNIKIAELENRIKLLETRTKTGETFDIKMSNLNEIISDKSKPGKSKLKEKTVNIEKETVPAVVEIGKEHEQLSPATGILPADAEIVTINQQKPPPEIEIKKVVENIPEPAVTVTAPPVTVPVNDSKTKPETAKKSTRSKNVKPKIVEIVKEDDEPIISEPIVKKTVNITKKGSSKTKQESKNTIETNIPPVINEPEQIQSLVSNIQQDTEKVIENPKEIIEKPKEIIEKPKEIIEKPKEIIEKPKEVIEKPQIKVSYPDNIPDYDNIEIIEINSVDYYKDINNNNIYQIIQDDNIGMFLGIYDKDTNSIIPFNDF